MERNQLLAEIRRRLQEAHGERLQGIVLYGSEARGEATEDSDLDLLVLLNGPIDYGKDLRANIDALYPLVLANNGRPIHAKPVDVTEYEAGEFALYRNAKQEGILL